jgi:hypothetical protein
MSIIARRNRPISAAECSPYVLARPPAGPHDKFSIEPTRLGLPKVAAQGEVAMALVPYVGPGLFLLLLALSLKVVRA